MKTPMQELIDTLKELQETQDPYTLQDAIELAESMLGKEKEYIKKHITNCDVVTFDDLMLEILDKHTISYERIIKHINN